MGKYAAGTYVAVSKTESEIKELLRRRGATRTAFAEEAGRAVVFFELRDRRVQFTMPLPRADEKRFTQDRRGNRRTTAAATSAREQACRERWRALLLTIKAKFVSIESEVETFEESFLAHLVVPGGKTVGQHALPAVAEAYRTGTMPPLLPAGEGPSRG
ncbi:hypothetical protein [Myxococcus virescens]|uniref:Uncharacterized protein n=1 Tax=Myxococcus virescens TaxID=83456 RepID=A0A511HL21_9BACT|nr:hypothetical protein [Myxococcus virescens]GEL73199.1 hypothetical protein MVI01_49830 [Myxococcus virescens]SDD64285.1 hypothetical protein SAMN04488504_10291 [Myxococcus virescens]